MPVVPAVSQSTVPQAQADGLGAEPSVVAHAAGREQVLDAAVQRVKDDMRTEAREGPGDLTMDGALLILSSGPLSGGQPGRAGTPDQRREKQVLRDPAGIRVG